MRGRGRRRPAQLGSAPLTQPSPPGRWVERARPVARWVFTFVEKKARPFVREPKNFWALALVQLQHPS